MTGENGSMVYRILVSCEEEFTQFVANHSDGTTLALVTGSTYANSLLNKVDLLPNFRVILASEVSHLIGRFIQQATYSHTFISPSQYRMRTII